MIRLDLYGFVPVSAYRVRLPEPLYPYRGKEAIEAFHVYEHPKEGHGLLSIEGLGKIFPAKFSHKNRLNTPGPIYGAETDTCLTGPAEAPFNVLIDKQGQEFVFKQPSNVFEFRDLVSAAMCECFQGYGSDGDSNWRLSLIREWWRDREEMVGCVDESQCDPISFLRWQAGLSGAFEHYLRVYAFFVENGRVPVADDLLPELQS